MVALLVAVAMQTSGGFELAYERGHEATGIPFTLNNNKIYVRTTVDAKGPFWFILDTGAAYTAIDLGLAKELGLKVAMFGKTGGGGTETRNSGFTTVGRVAVKGLSYHPATTSALELDNVLQPVEGMPVHGLLGGDLLNHAVVEIDYVHKTLSFQDPATFRHSGPHAGVPITVVGHMFVEGSVDGIAAKFVVDTGDGLGLSLNTPFVNEHHLLPPKRELTVVGSGFGGKLEHALARTAVLKIGDVTINNVITTLSHAASGAFASKSSQGMIGAEILKRYRVTIDYPHKMMYLDPGGIPGPMEFDCSGMFLIQKDGIEVLSVALGSPAAEAGVLAGDVLTEIEGKPTAKLSLEEIRRSLKREGDKVNLKFQRSGTVRKVGLKLRMRV